MLCLCTALGVIIGLIKAMRHKLGIIWDRFHLGKVPTKNMSRYKVTRCALCLFVFVCCLCVGEARGLERRGDERRGRRNEEREEVNEEKK